MTAEARYRPGDILFREGDPSEVVLRVLAGEADVVKDCDGRPVVLGSVRPGEFVGEMGVIEDLPRSATVRAASDLTVEVIPKDEFLRRISGDSGAALQLIVRLSERLRAVSQQFATAFRSAPSDEGGGVAARLGQVEPVPEGTRITLFPASDALAGQLPAEGLAVTEVPLTVGRLPVAGEGAPLPNVRLRFEDARPYRLSRAHFAIQRRGGGGGYVVRDLGSVLGTAVNGAFLGHHFATDTVPLEPGDNEIVAGGAGSPFTFRVVLDRA